jgi:transcriptional regulator with XRE-family HTH domain
MVMISPMRAKRFWRELSLWELGKQTNIEPARLSLIERGYKKPRPDEIKRIAEALGCSMSELLPNDQ